MTSEQKTPPVNDVAQQTSQEYAKLLAISSDVQLEAVDESIESVLTRLDELYGMLDMIRSENASAIEELLPQVQVKIHCLNPVFKQIDQLEAFVEVVKKNVATFESQVKLKEDEYSALNSIKKAISSFSLFGRKKKLPSELSPKPTHPYTPPVVFSTSQYLTLKPKASEEDETTNSDI